MVSTVKEDSATAVVSKDSDELTEEATRLSRRSWLGAAGRAAALGAAGVLASAPASVHAASASCYSRHGSISGATRPYGEGVLAGSDAGTVYYL